MNESGAMGALDWLVQSALPFLVVITIVVFVHELGHYLVARRLGIAADVFSVGFGRELLGFTDRRGTRWRLNAVPLGGYVRFRGDEDAASARPGNTSLQGSFAAAAAWRRALVVLAGPLANMALTFLLFTCVIFVRGLPSSEAFIGSIEARDGTPGASVAPPETGLKAGDYVLAIDGVPTPDFDTLTEAISEAAGQESPAQIIRNGQRITVTLSIPPATDIHQVLPGSAAADAGIRAGDRVLAIDGVPITSFGAIVRTVVRSQGNALRLRLMREGATFERTVVPRPYTGADGTRGFRIGIGHYSPFVILPRVERAHITHAMGAGLSLGWRIVSETGSVLARLVQGNREAADSVGGPIMIAQYAKRASESGVSDFLLFLGQVSLSIGLLNLLPIPVLDGGHLLFIGFEMVRRRRLGERWQMIASGIGFSLLMALMAFVLYQDLGRI